jgi:hypothetical protein
LRNFSRAAKKAFSALSISKSTFSAFFETERSKSVFFNIFSAFGTLFSVFFGVFRSFLPFFDDFWAFFDDFWAFFDDFGPFCDDFWTIFEVFEWFSAKFGVSDPESEELSLKKWGKKKQLKIGNF